MFRNLSNRNESNNSRGGRNNTRYVDSESDEEEETNHRYSRANESRGNQRRYNNKTSVDSREVEDEEGEEVSFFPANMQQKGHRAERASRSNHPSASRSRPTPKRPAGITWMGLTIRAMLWSALIAFCVLFVARRVTLMSLKTPHDEGLTDTARITATFLLQRSSASAWYVIQVVCRHTIMHAIPAPVQYSFYAMLDLIGDWSNYEPSPSVTSNPMASSQPTKVDASALYQNGATSHRNSFLKHAPFHHPRHTLPIPLEGSDAFHVYVQHIADMPLANSAEMMMSSAATRTYGRQQTSRAQCTIQSFVHEDVVAGKIRPQINTFIPADTAQQNMQSARVWFIHVHEHGLQSTSASIMPTIHRSPVTLDNDGNTYRYSLTVYTTQNACQSVNMATASKGAFMPCASSSDASVSDNAPMIMGIMHLSSSTPLSMKQVVNIAYDENEVWSAWRLQMTRTHRTISASAATIPVYQQQQQQQPTPNIVWHTFFTTAYNDTTYAKRQWHYLQMAVPYASPTVAQSIPAADDISLLASQISAIVPPYDVPSDASSDNDLIQTFKAMVVSYDRLVLARVRRVPSDSQHGVTAKISSLWRRMRENQNQRRAINLDESVDMLVSRPLPQDFFDVGVASLAETITPEAWHMSLVPGTEFAEWYEYFLLLAREKMWRLWHPGHTLHAPLVPIPPQQYGSDVVGVDYASILHDLVVPSILDMNVVTDDERVDIRRAIRRALASSASAFSSKGSVPIVAFASSFNADINDATAFLHARLTSSANELGNDNNGAAHDAYAPVLMFDRDHVIKSLSEMCSYDTTSDRLQGFGEASKMISHLMPDIYPMSAPTPPAAATTATQPRQPPQDWRSMRQAAAAAQQSPPTVQPAARYSAQASAAAANLMPAVVPSMGNCIELASAIAWYDVLHSDLFMSAQEMNYARSGKIMTPEELQHTSHHRNRLSVSKPTSVKEPILNQPMSSGHQQPRRQFFQQAVSPASCNTRPESNWEHWRANTLHTQDRLVVSSHVDESAIDDDDADLNSLDESVVGDTPHKQQPTAVPAPAIRQVTAFVNEWNDNALVSNALPASWQPLSFKEHNTHVSYAHVYLPTSVQRVDDCEASWQEIDAASSASQLNKATLAGKIAPMCVIHPSSLHSLKYQWHVIKSCYGSTQGSNP